MMMMVKVMGNFFLFFSEWSLKECNKLVLKMEDTLVEHMLTATNLGDMGDMVDRGDMGDRAIS